MAAASADRFSLTYDPTHYLLIGHWLSGQDDQALYPSYQQLLAAAKAHDNCRYWLLDMQQRAWHSASFTQWYTDLLANLVVRELGAPVFVAYVAAEHHRSEIDSVATQAMLRQTAQVEFYPYFLNNESSARDWLVYHQTHPAPLLAPKAR